MRTLEKEGIRARMVDLLWLNPLDEEAIRATADDCGRLLIVDEDRRTCGAGSAIADVVYRDPELRKKTDIERLASLDCRVSAVRGRGTRRLLPGTESDLPSQERVLEHRIPGLRLHPLAGHGEDLR